MNNLFKTLFLTFILISFSYAQGPMMDPSMNPQAKKSKGKKRPDLKDNRAGTFSSDYKYDTSIQHVIEYTIFDVEDSKFAYINVPNLKVGQSGIIINKQNNPIIIAIASVIESDDKKTKIEFSKYEDLKQDAIPTSNLQIKDGDILVLKYLYEASMVIAPNVDSFQLIRKKLSDYSFLHPDLFAAYLKVQETPIPTKEIIQAFAIDQNLGSIAIVVENKAYLLDTRTFKIIETINMQYDNSNTMSPFYTRVEEIQTGTFDFGAESIGEYTKYYKELLDI